MKANNVFSVLYRTRVKVQKDDTPILNLSLIFSIIAVCSAPWLAVIGLVVALVLGYRFSIERNAAEFSGSFQDVVNSAAANVKGAVSSFTGTEKERRRRIIHSSWKTSCGIVAGCFLVIKSQIRPTGPFFAPKKVTKIGRWRMDRRNGQRRHRHFGYEYGRSDDQFLLHRRHYH